MKKISSTLQLFLVGLMILTVSSCSQDSGCEAPASSEPIVVVDQGVELITQSGGEVTLLSGKIQNNNGGLLLPVEFNGYFKGSQFVSVVAHYNDGVLYENLPLPTPNSIITLHPPREIDSFKLVATLSKDIYTEDDEDNRVIGDFHIQASLNDQVGALCKIYERIGGISISPALDFDVNVAGSHDIVLRFYDNQNEEVLFTGRDVSIAISYDTNNAPLVTNLDGISLTNSIFTLDKSNVNNDKCILTNALKYDGMSGSREYRLHLSYHNPDGTLIRTTRSFEID